MNNTNRRTPIRDVPTLVEHFGGTTKFAEWADVGSSCVSNWKALGAIPTGYHLRLYLETRRRGLIVDPEIFGLEPELFEAAAA